MPYLGEVMTKKEMTDKDLADFLAPFGIQYDKEVAMLFCKLIHERKLMEYMSQEDVDKELASRKESEIDDSWSKHNVDGGDDE